MKRTGMIVIGCLLLLWIVLPVRAEHGDAGSNSVDFLRMGVGAAPAAQGEAYAARGGEIDALYYNPAALALVPKTTVQLQHNEYLLDIHSEYLAMVYPYKDWCFGGSAFILDEGDFTRRTYANPVNAGRFDAGAQVYSLALARELNKRINVGFAVRYFQEEIDNANRNGFSFDIGLHTLAESGVWEFGVVARNIGSSVRFDLENEDLPFEIGVGLSLPKIWGRYRLSAEVVMPHNQETELKAGVDIPIGDFVSIRTGYDSRNDLDNGWSAGIGFTWETFTLDYAYVPFKEAGDAHRVSMNIKFGPDHSTQEKE